jgi:glycosyltransferase involved in cell wall biosynthesis
MHYLSIGAIFKNEAMAIKEWIDHHKFHGVDHIYLIDDNSTDRGVDILQPYIDSGFITLFNNDVPKIQSRQAIAYNKYFKPILHETKWLAIIDIDEYLYSPSNIHLPDIFKTLEAYSEIEVNWVWFGSNGHKLQPASIVESFTKRAPYFYETYIPMASGRVHAYLAATKTIINTAFHLHDFGIHGHFIDGTKLNVSLKGDGRLLLNHYAVMSEEYWVKIKQTRGDVNNHHPDNARNMNYFNALDINIEEDLLLFNQNKTLFPRAFV